MAFESPNFTQIPNELLGIQHTPGLMADMSEAELKVTLAICRLTFGFHRDEIRVSISTLQGMTGLSRQGVINGIKAAEIRGVIEHVAEHGKTGYWRALIKTSQPNGLVETSQPNGLVDSQLVNEVDSTSQRSRLMKETKKKTSSKKETEGRGKKTPPPPPTHNPTYLPEAEQQIGLLLGANKPGIADPSQDAEHYMRTSNDWLKIVKQRTGRWPDANVQKPAILELVKQENADLEFWDQVVTAWVGLGWNKRNITGMIDYYQRREIPQTGRNGGNHARSESNQLDDRAKRIAEAFNSTARSPGQ